MLFSDIIKRIVSVRIIVEVIGLSRITKEQVKHVSHLARLEINDEQAEIFAEQLDGIIQLAETLNEVDTTNVEPTSHVIEMKNVFREDVAEQGLSYEELFKNVPDHQDGQIKVPSILE